MKRHSTTRRQFLHNAATLAAAPLILSSRVWGGVTPSERLNLALIGAGGRGNGLLNNTVGLKEAQIVAVCDCFQDRRETTRDKLNTYYTGDYVKAYADFREVLARDDIDGVIVATPDHWHVPIAIAAARAKKPMYVEKPLGVSMEWAWDLRKAVKENNAIFQYGTQQRSAPQFRQACELARNGYLGEIERVDVWCPDMSSQFSAFHAPYGSTKEVPVPDGFDYDRWLGPAPVSPYTVDRCTPYGTYHVYDNCLGFIAGWGAHPLDIAQWGLDTDGTGPVHYAGTGTIPTEGIYNTIASWDVHCTYKSGVKIHFMGHRVAEPVVTQYRDWKDHGTTFFGTDGWVSIDRGGIYASDPKLLYYAMKKEDVLLQVSDHHMGNFVAAARTGSPTISTLEAAIRSDTISHLSDFAIRLGRPIRWDPENERILDDPEATALLHRDLRPPWDLSKAMVS